MRAVILEDPRSVRVVDVPTPSPAPGEVRVRLAAAALNHRDIWILRGMYAGTRYPVLPGSDGAGVVDVVADPSDSAWLGREVIINPAFDWGHAQQAQGTCFSILGSPRPGTLAEYVCVPTGQLAPKPTHLGWHEAAALPLAGLTAHRALFARAQLRRHERALISGIGGGVATLALKMAVAAGAHVWVTSSSPAKIEQARTLGAHGGFLYSTEHWHESAASEGLTFDVVVDSAGGPGFTSLVEVAAPGGRIVFFGATRGDVPALPLRKLFWKQISLFGTTMGSPEDWQHLMRYVEHHSLRPVVDRVFPLSEAPAAFARLESGEQLGKVVVDTHDLGPR